MFGWFTRLSIATSFSIMCSWNSVVKECVAQRMSRFKHWMGSRDTNKFFTQIKYKPLVSVDRCEIYPTELKLMQ